GSHRRRLRVAGKGPVDGVASQRRRRRAIVGADVVGPADVEAFGKRPVLGGWQAAGVGAGGSCCGGSGDGFANPDDPFVPEMAQMYKTPRRTGASMRPPP
ncbi:hypothetical protein KSS87_022331, partial [Heliosperma pusillum]